jgi:2,3-diketo-5-methylthio-1-phosphopentane phosphatase
MTNAHLKVFVDFDGTITRQDVGNSFFRKFGNATESAKLVKMWKDGDLSGRDLTAKEAEYVRADENQALRYVEGFEIDPAFKAFLSFCKQHSLDVAVLSDGLDFYVTRIFEVNGISGLPLYVNRAHFTSDRVSVEFPYESECTRCGNCKGYQILTRTGVDDIVAYVGNGFSDRCAVQYADIIFAKDELLKYCEENNITFFPFETFDDVTEKLTRILDSGKFRKRHRAELRRKEAYISE